MSHALLALQRVSAAEAAAADTASRSFGSDMWASSRR